MFKFKDYSIKLKLIVVFIIFKIVPLLLLAGIGIVSFIEIDGLLKERTGNIIKSSQNSLEKTTYTAITDSIEALDAKSQSNLEYLTVLLADRIAHFLRERDEDVRFLSTLDINQKTLQEFYAKKNKEVYVPAKYFYDAKNDRWVSKELKNQELVLNRTSLEDNANEFHKVKKQERKKEIIPIYKEITFFRPDGKEIYKVSSIDATLKDISLRKNTYLHAEKYFQEAKKLKKGEIYVSEVIGAYVPSPVIGSFTRKKAAKMGVVFEPQKYAYAGKENPVGKKFEGIVRFVAPVYDGSKLLGYLTLALDHRHLMDYTDYFNPLSPQPLDIPDASNGNYAFMWDSNFSCISHPRDYFIMGYDPKTGRKVPGWIDASLAKKFKESNESDLSSFLQKQPVFFKQSLKKKPNIEQLKKGEIGLDCKYLNFAPQCEGWSELVGDGGYGSFVIFWSKVWKLTTAAAIPYYVQNPGSAKKSFGFVTIGANVEEFHSAANETKKNIDKVIDKENENITQSISAISNEIYNKIKVQIVKISFTTLVLIVLVVYVAVLIANNISSRIKSVLVATKKLKENDFNYKIESNAKDEIGQLAHSFNEMADSIDTLNKGLKRQLYIDELTGLHNRKSLQKDLKKSGEKTLILLDIDSFKNINDYYGSDAGNYILKEIADALRAFTNDTDMRLYRIGSDEFVLLKEGRCNKEELEQIMHALEKSILDLHFTKERLPRDIRITFSGGVSFGEENLVAYADLALNEAKRTKSLFMIYDPTNLEMNRQSEFILWRTKLEYAIENDNIVVFYQPIVDVKNPQNKKYESLIRMIDNDKVIAPHMFLKVAKESKLYPQLTKIVIEKTFRKFQNIDADFSINISIDDIQNEDTVAFLVDALKHYNVQDKLILEILETEEIDNFETVRPFIAKMRKLRVRFAIDDFGSGYSNFSYILQIRPDYIKIDGSLIKNIHLDSDEYYVVDAIVKFAKSLDIKLIAEHVSSKEILEVLEGFDIDYMQGYYLSEPLEVIQGVND